MTQIVHKTTVQRGLSAHAAIGLLASALIYLICITGTLSVFYEELQRVEQPHAPEMAAIAPDAVQRGVAQVLASEKGKPRTSHLYVHMPAEALPRAIVTTDSQAVHIDAQGRVADAEENAWSDWLVELHYTLTLPPALGMLLVGALGVMLLALIVTGVIAHPRIFRDAFRLRARNRNGGVALADWHNRLGVWTLPFAVAVTLTGTMIALGTPGALGLATAFYKGDIEASYASIFGAEAQPDERPAPVPDVAGALRQMAERFPQASPYYVVIEDPLTAAQQVQILATHRRRLIYGETYLFDANAHFTGTVGLSDGPLGQQVAASSYNLHFGNFAGLPVKIVYFLLGMALCVVTATGVSIWLGKRERRGYAQPRLRGAWNATVWGIPLALSLAFEARLLIGNAAPLGWIFWGGFALSLVSATLAAGKRNLAPLMAKGLALALAVNLGTALLAAAMGG